MVIYGYMNKYRNPNFHPNNVESRLIHDQFRCYPIRKICAGAGPRIGALALVKVKPAYRKKKLLSLGAIKIW